MARQWTRTFGLFLAGWLVVTLLLFSATSVFTPFLYFLTSYVGFLLAVEYSAPRGVRPPRHRLLRWVSVAGFVVFLSLVVGWTWRVALNGAV